MAKRQQVTKLLAVMAMTASPALAGPEHGHARGPAPATATATVRTPAPRPAPEPAARSQPRRPRQATPATPTPSPAPAAARTTPAMPAAPAAAQGPGLLEMHEALFGIARPRELPNGRPAPGNVTSRTSSRSDR